MRASLDRDQRHFAGLTLIELLVALVLSVLVLAMLLPLLSQLMLPSNQLDVKPEAVWSCAMAADLRELVSSAKSANPVVRIVPLNESDPMPELLVETFCRMGQDSNVPASRGPTEVRYRLEPVQNHGPFALVRYSQGWHDSLSDRLVLANDLTSWNLVADMTQATSATTQNGNTTQRAEPLPVALHVQLLHLGGSESVAIWIPQGDVPDLSRGSENDAGVTIP